MNKETRFIIPLSFITAAFLAAVIFVVSGIYPGSERTLLIFDMKEQFVSFYAYMSRVRSLSDLTFTFQGSLGTPLAGLIAYAFENTDFDRLEAYHRAENAKSGRVLVKSNMHITDTVERFKRAGEQPAGEVCYCIERNDYLELKEDIND